MILLMVPMFGLPCEVRRRLASPRDWLIIHPALVNMILERMPIKTMRQNGSKLQNFIHNSYLTFYRFGTSERKDIRRENWPGPGDTEVPDYTTGTQKKFSKRDPGADQILNPKKLDELRKKHY